MFPFFSVLLFVLLSIVHCQDPRKRLILGPIDYQKDDDIGCNTRSCIKRSASQDDMGPFWANRGKKDPTYTHEKFFVDEPHWILVRKDREDEPFFNSRGKKPLYWKTFRYSYGDTFKSRRDRSVFGADADIDPEFFAARGKKAVEKY